MKSLKERTFYALEVNDLEGKTLLGVWDNPSLAERELRRMKEEAPLLGEYCLEIPSIKPGHLTFEFHRCFTDDQSITRTLTSRPIKLNVRLA